MWPAGAFGLCNHIWQSTVFAGLAALLAVALRKYRAQVRYWLWIMASAKFLIPFALLVLLGSHLAWPRHPTEAKTSIYAAVEGISEPFTAATEFSEPLTSIAVQSTVSHHPAFAIPALLSEVWLSGLIVVVASWYVQWRRIATAIRQACPMEEGRVIEALRRMEQIAAMTRPMEILSSQGSMEPGVFGFIRPILVWPERISRHLDDEQLEAILAHEVCHVKRRDNLSSLIHMTVEAIFWFHPLVWWMEKKLVEERERACDEEVLRLLGQPHVYAASILKVCEFSIESPLPCVSGITGSDLKKRIVNILADRVALKLDFSKKALLFVAASLAIAVPLVSGQVKTMDGQSTPNRDHVQLLSDQQPASQKSSIAVRGDASHAPVARGPSTATRVTQSRVSLPPTATSIADHVNSPLKTQAATGPSMLSAWPKPAASKLVFENAVVQKEESRAFIPASFPLSNDDAFTPTGGVFRAAFPLWVYIQFAYKLPPLTRDQRKALFSQLPQWATTDRFEIRATASGNPAKDEMRLMMQSLLADRFKLKVHFETEQLPVFALTLAKPGQLGPKLRPHSQGPPCDTSTPLLAQLASHDPTVAFPPACEVYALMPKPGDLRIFGSRNTTMVLMAASLAGLGILDKPVIDKTGLSGRFDFSIEWGKAIDPDNAGAAFQQALQEQLGLVLETTRSSVETLLIDQVEMPSTN
jgi:uncharacterized protein (TIGR03435 family)